MTPTDSILYLEDEIIVALETTMILEDMGFGVVRSAHSLAEARRLVESEQFSHALLDVNLGHGETSCELGRDLMRMGVHVVFASGYSRKDIASQIDCAGYVDKPIQQHALQSAMRQPAAPIYAAE